ncbi:MAG TPA: glycosyltransferase family 39 protein [Solirubrobacteraceae bacterium]|nr:glycosyltransferase family 39 protein [Solirubrobacteraceae bacterium]
MSVGSLATDDLRGPLSGRRAGLTGAIATPTFAMVAALTALAAVLRFYGIGHQGFWFDEANTALLVHFSPGKMLGLIPQSESTPPLYYCAAWVWARIFGDGEAGLRSLSALAGVLVVPVAYGVAAKLVARRAGVIAAALTACNPLLIWYSQEARSYELLVLLTGLSLLAFVYARAAPTTCVLVLWVLAAAAALATHYYAALAVVPQAVWLLVVHRDRRGVRIAVGIVAVCGLALIPLAASQNGTGHDSWIASAALWPRLRQIIPQFLIGTNAPERKLVKYVAYALVVVALGLLAVRARPAERREPLVAGGLALGGFALGLVLVVAGFDDLITRNILALWLPAAVMVAGALALPRARIAGTAVAVGLCAIGVFATVGIAADRSLQRPDWRYVARALGIEARAGTAAATGPPATTAAGAGRLRASTGAGRAILIQHYGDLLPLSLYLPHLQTFSAPERVTEVDVISMVSPQQPLCWWGAACNLIPSQMQRRYDIPGFRIVSRRHVLQFTILRMVARRPVRLTRAEVARSLHTTSLRRDKLIYQRR